VQVCTLQQLLQVCDEVLVDHQCPSHQVLCHVPRAWCPCEPTPAEAQGSVAVALLRVLLRPYHRLHLSVQNAGERITAATHWRNPDCYCHMVRDNLQRFWLPKGLSW
jgi:hypothetical protein